MSFVNLNTSRKNYYVKTDVKDENGINIIGTLKNKPNAAGITVINIEGIIKTLCGYNNTYHYNTINSRDILLGGGISNVTFTEYYLNTEHESTTAKNYRYANAVKQIQEKYGSNLLDYYPNTDDKKLPKFMSDFVRPTYFPGFPFSLTFIKWNDDDTPWIKRQENYDANGNLLTWNDISLQNGNYVHRTSFYENYPPAGTKKIITYIHDEDDLQLTESKEINVDDNCKNNPVYLCWLGKRGGINYWLFNKTQTKGKQITNAQEYAVNTSDLENEIAFSEFYNKDSVPQLILGATEIGRAHV